MSGNCSTSPEEESATGRPDRDPLARAAQRFSSSSAISTLCTPLSRALVSLRVRDARRDHAVPERAGGQFVARRALSTRARRVNVGRTRWPSNPSPPSRTSSKAAVCSSLPSARFCRSVLVRQALSVGYDQLRVSLGRVILLGLEIH
jgi:hypothetical protein